MNHWYVTVGLYLLWSVDIIISLYVRKLKKSILANEREILAYKRSEDTLQAFFTFKTATPCWQHEDANGLTDDDREFLREMAVSL